MGSFLLPLKIFEVEFLEGNFLRVAWPLKEPSFPLLEMFLVL